MNKSNTTITNVKLVFIAQVFVLLVNIVRTLFIPKILTIQEYGYWQTYLLYVSYISIFYLGFNDGVYLKCVGWDGNKYKKNTFSAVYKIFASILFVETIVLIAACYLIKSEYYYIYILVALNIPEMGLLGTTSYYYQLSGKMENYTLSVVAAKVIFLVVLILLWISGFISATGLMCTDFIASLIVLIYILIKERKILIFGHIKFTESIKEFTSYIRAGYSVMLGAYIALLFSGICRIFIQNTSTIEEFSYYSFALSISNIIIVCFGSLGLALYPEIAKMGSDNYGSNYLKIERIINVLTPLMLVGYYASYLLIMIYMDKYLPAMRFLGLSFVIVILQLKINVLNNTYYKLLRLEKKMLTDNIVSLIQLVIGCFILQNVEMILYCQIVVMIYRVYKSRCLFSKIIPLNYSKIGIEIITLGIYLICLKFGKIGMMTFLTSCALFYIINFNELKDVIKLFLKRRSA